MMTEETGVTNVGAGSEITHDEETPTPAPPRAHPQATSTASVNDAVASDDGDGAGNANVEGLGIGHFGTIDDEEAPPVHPQQFEKDILETEKLEMEGSIEMIPDSAPFPDEVAVLAHNDSHRPKGLSTQRGPNSPPVPDEWVALSHDDSLGLARVKQRQNKTIHECEGVDAHPHSSTLPSALTEYRNRDDIGRAPHQLGETNATPTRDALTADHTQPHLSTLPSVIAENRDRDEIGREATQPSETNTTPTPDALTANVHAMSPFINDRNEIIIPEATAVNPSDIPRASIVRPERYSLTIAGRKVQLRFLALGAMLILGASIALAATLSKNAADDSGDEDEPRAPHAPSTALSVSLFPTLGPTHAPRSAPSASLLPTSEPSLAPSTGPSTALQAELVGIILEFSGGNISSSFSDGQSNHRKALGWLVNDQLKWRDEKDSLLSTAEIAERFALALLHFETRGEEWFQDLEFLTGDHVCRWRGYLQRTFKKGVTNCTNGGGRRVTNLTLWDNHLQGGLPTEIGFLQELAALHVGDNKIQGDIPSTLGSLTNITHLELYDNDLAGRIASLSGLTNLKLLDVSKNDFNGSINSLSGLANLESFKANGNKFSGSISKSFSNISSLDTLHLKWNHFLGNVDFLCKDLPSDYEFDCDGNKPEIECTCCVGCTIVNATSCDPETEKLLTLNIFAGNRRKKFEWQLRDHPNTTEALIAAGGDYDDGQQLNIQLCLSAPGLYEIYMKADVPTRPPTFHPTYTPTITHSPTATHSPTYHPTTPYPSYPPYTWAPSTSFPTEQQTQTFTPLQPQVSPTPPTSRSSIILTNPSLPFAPSCTDKPDYKGLHGNGCDYYGTDVNYPQACQLFGVHGGNGMTPNENCCVCKGLLQTPPSNMPPRADKPTGVLEASVTTLSAKPTDEAAVQALNVPFPTSYPAVSHTSARPSPTYHPTATAVGISFSIDGNSYAIRNKMLGSQLFSVAANPTSSPTESPTISFGPTTATLSPTSPITSFPTPAPSFGNSALLEQPDKTLSPTLIVTRPPPCDGMFELKLTTDAFGADSAWELIDRNEDVVVVSKNGFASNQTLWFEECLYKSKCYDFVIKDYWDDGICCEQGKGSYEVTVNGRLVGSGGEFASSKTVPIGGSCSDFPFEGWPSRT